jgi:hypothetical protein
MAPDNGRFTLESVTKTTESPSFGQKALNIILEDQKRVARRRGTGGIYPSDRPVIQFGETLSAIILADYRDESVGDVVVRTDCSQKAVFDNEILNELFAEVKPGKPAKAEGKGWYHHVLKIYLEQSQWVRQKPMDDIDSHRPVDLSFRVRLSRDAKKVVIKFSVRPTGSDAKTKPIIKKRLVFEAFASPDFKGMFHQRMVAVPR